MGQLSHKNSSGLRIAQIVLGLIAIGVSIGIIVYPGAGMATIVFLLSIALLAVGFERIVTGIFPNHTKSSRLEYRIRSFSNWSRYGSYFLSCRNIILFNIITGYWIALFRNCKNNTRFYKQTYLRLGKSISIGVGVFCLVISFAIFASPLTGAVFLAVILGVCLLIVGIEAVVNGVTGRGNLLTSASNTMGYGK